MSLPETCPFCGAGARAMKDANQSWVEFKCFSMIGNVAGEFQYRSPICRHAELNAAKARIAEMENCIETITDGFQREQNDIEQTCGKVLGYPRYCDDQKNFPGATEKDGVCVGEHVASSIAAELANKYRDLLARNKRLEEALSNVELVMQRPASNHRMMQIAEPARRVLNIIKQVKEYKQCTNQKN